MPKRPLGENILEIRKGILDSLDEPDTLNGGDGGGTSGGMEERIKRLETELASLIKTVTELRVDFARFDERSKSFPTKGFIFSVALGLLAAGGTLMAIIVRFVHP